MHDDNLVKILFRFHSDVLDGMTVETIWAIVVDKEKGHYQIDNIPLYIPMLSCGDIVYAEYDEQEERLTYRETIRESGNSTIQVVVLPGVWTEAELRDFFSAFGCESEGTGKGYFVLEVPADLDYAPIKQQLEGLFKERAIDYAEPCLSEKHDYST